MPAQVRRSSRPRRGRARAGLWAAVVVGLGLIAAGCAKYNTYYNASKFFRQAEQEREDRIKAGQDPGQAASGQKSKYEETIKKCQKVLDEYPGSGLSDDALFLMAKSYHRLQSYRMSIRKFDLLFANFPATEYGEEALFLQALNHMFIGDVGGSNELLELLASNYPESRFQGEAQLRSGENSFALEDWEGAAAAFRDYLAQYPDGQEADRITYQYARCLWELEDHAAADSLLQGLAARTSSGERAFEARLLRARCLTRLGRHEDAAALLERLRPEAEVYEADGDVTLAEAENLFIEGKSEQAAPLLENMPQEWKTREVGPRVNDLLGWIHFRRWELEEARERFQEAVRGATILERPANTRRVLRQLQDYLAAEQGLADARPERVPGLKLLQANALLFGLERPRLALDLYLEIAGLEAADSTAAARALYGAYVVYEEHLALPDSARLVAERLQAEHPTSPQAYQLRTGAEGDLLAYLQGLQEEQRLASLAGATAPEEAGPAQAGVTETVEAVAQGKPAEPAAAIAAQPDPDAPSGPDVRPAAPARAARSYRARMYKARPAGTAAEAAPPVPPAPIPAAADTSGEGGDP